MKTVKKRKMSNRDETLTALYILVVAKGVGATLVGRQEQDLNVHCTGPVLYLLEPFLRVENTFLLAQVPIYSSTLHVTICKLYVSLSLILHKKLDQKNHFKVPVDTR